MRFFVTGATGFIGGALARELIDDQHEVVALARNPDSASELARVGVQVERGDITDKDSMRAPMTGADGVFHLAGWYKVGVGDTSPGEPINVQGTRNVLELARELEIPKAVYTSTIAVFADTHGQVADESFERTTQFHSEYERTKWVAHYEVALPMIRAGLPLVIVMPGGVYGPGEQSPIFDALSQWIAGRLPVTPRGTGYSWAHVDDIARGHVLAMERGQPGETYLLTGPNHTLERVFEIAGPLVGRTPPPLRAPAGLLRAAARVMSAVEKIVPVPETFASESLSSGAGVTLWGTSEKARRELGFETRSFEDGLPDALEDALRRLGRPIPDALARALEASARDHG